jgi:hypothetical protein
MQGMSEKFSNKIGKKKGSISHIKISLKAPTTDYIKKKGFLNLKYSIQTKKKKVTKSTFKRFKAHH